MLLTTLILLLLPLSQLIFLMNFRGYYSYCSIIHQASFISRKNGNFKTVFRPLHIGISDGTTAEGQSETQFQVGKQSLKEEPRRPKVIFVLGGPGAGKGTQCAKLSLEFGIKHLSAGELLREEKLKPTENGRLIDSYLKEGKIVPVEISLNLLRGAIEQQRWNRYLIDGFPRNWDNLKGWERIMSDVVDVESILFIECEEAELARRLISRGQYSGRDDDNAETARKRFVTFKESTMPVVDHFAGEKDSRLTIVDGCQPVESVYVNLRTAVLPNIRQEIVEVTQSEVDRLYNTDSSVARMVVVNPSVQVDGQSASITYDLQQQEEVVNRQLGQIVMKQESKVWNLINGQWR